MNKKIATISALAVLCPIVASCGRSDYNCSNPDVTETLKKIYLKNSSPLNFKPADTEEDAKTYVAGTKVHTIQTINKNEFGYECRAIIETPKLRRPRQVENYLENNLEQTKTEWEKHPTFGEFDPDREKDRVDSLFTTWAQSVTISYRVQFTDDGKFVVYAKP